MAELAGADGRRVGFAALDYDVLDRVVAVGERGVDEVLDDAARILDESIAQPRPRYFAFIGSSGLEIGVIGDAIAAAYDVNLAVDARAATLIERQAVRWAAEFVGYPADAAGAFTSGGTVSNTTALAAARTSRTCVRGSLETVAISSSLGA